MNTNNSLIKQIETLNEDLEFITQNTYLIERIKNLNNRILKQLK
jgi:hypothetical protein